MNTAYAGIFGATPDQQQKVPARPNRAHRRRIEQALKAERRRGQRAYLRVLSAQERQRQDEALAHARQQRG